MSKYLDHERLPDILRKYYSDEKVRRSRLVGADRQFESAYFDFVRFFGPTAVKPSDIKIQYKDQLFAFDDPRILEFSHHVEAELRAEGRLYDGPPVMKLMSFEPASVDKIMRVQPASYGDQAGSCFALDLKHKLFGEWGGTLRLYLLKMNPIHAQPRNPLAVCLGVAGYVHVVEGGNEFLLQVRRSGKLASLENSQGPSVAGSVDWRTDCVNLQELIVKSVEAELHEELGLSANDCRIVPLGYATEILRGERPQLFALIESHLSRELLRRRLEQISAESREFSSFEFLRLSDSRLSEERIAALNCEAQTCYYLAEEYLVGHKKAAR